MTSITVVSPVYNAENIVDELVTRTVRELQEITPDFEIILVEDGSSDDSWRKIEDQCKTTSRVKGIKLSRNFGQHYAVTAGITHAKGDVVVLMDCDLQDDPRHIQTLYNKLNEGYDIVFTKRLKRKHSLFKSITAFLYNILFTLFSDKRYDIDVGSMVMFSRKVRDEFVKIKDHDRLYIQLLKWLGFRSVYVYVEHNPRFSGKSTYSFFKLVNIAVQGWISHSDKLLRLSVYIGFVFSSISFLSIIYIVTMYFIEGFQSGWASLAVLVLMSTGLILISIGVVGIYLGKTFQQTKDRPLFIVENAINIDSKT
jgi:glycosyltransferase involved in cell wall biosynthesis